MQMSAERRINLIREHLICIATYLGEQSRGAKESQGLEAQDVAIMAEDVLVMFERLINDVLAGARS
jgi:hypothetical protein